jgi:hypothetical protein
MYDPGVRANLNSLERSFNATCGAGYRVMQHSAIGALVTAGVSSADHFLSVHLIAGELLRFPKIREIRRYRPELRCALKILKGQASELGHGA